VVEDDELRRDLPATQRDPPRRHHHRAELAGTFLIICGGIHAGGRYGYGDRLPWFWYTTLLDIVGGLGVVTLLRLVRSKELIEQERQKVSDGD
jgi:hypothetical protein